MAYRAATVAFLEHVRDDLVSPYPAGVKSRLGRIYHQHKEKFDDGAD
jgi:hypothetical protein